MKNFEPKNSLISQYRSLFDIDNIDLIFTEKAILAIAKEAIAKKTGARGLRAIIEKKLNNLMFEVPSMEGVDEVIIDETFIKGTAEAKITSSAFSAPVKIPTATAKAKSKATKQTQKRKAN